MLNKIKNRKQEGFTIIEVLIVLAIAGLILLIVFLAVPALQRNSRNTQRKNDVAAIGGALSEYANNNNGRLPANATDMATAVDGAKLGFYTAADVTGSTFNTSAQASVTPTDGGVVVNNFSKCPANNPAPAAIAAVAMGTGASSRNLTALYRVDTSGESQTICQEL
ncbi:MAG: hypothetical protein QG628_271 [Patescibacteria group bacterium]|nr:hypothetical protein [Patescibacteria group bacterium]